MPQPEQLKTLDGHLSPDEESKLTKFLWARNAPGITKINVASFYYAVFMTIASYTFVNSAQRLVLSTILNIPSDELGKATGDLGFYNELLIIFAVSPWGVLSDKIGRKPVYAAGLFLIAIAFILYPFAPNYGALVGFRLIYAVGAAAAAAMLTAVLADYVYIRDRGHASGLMGLFSGFGALLAALILLKIPEWISPDGENTVYAIRAMYIITAMTILLSAIILLVTMQGKSSIQEANHSILPLKLWWGGFKAAWDDPRLGLSYMAGFVARGDAVVLTTFLSLWVQDYATGVLNHLVQSDYASFV